MTERFRPDILTPKMGIATLHTTSDILRLTKEEDVGHFAVRT